ncbi:MAG TPA: hypothetical protein VK015_07310 [Microbacterium sp.]|nr:hypothetical protein [Microbacterium sp.]
MTAETKVAHRGPAWLRAVVAGIFGLRYAYAFWAGLGNLLAMNSLAEFLGGTMQPTAWIALILAMIVPVAVFAIAVTIGVRRALWKLAVLLLVGLALVGVFWINVQGLFTHPAVVFQ